MINVIDTLNIKYDAFRRYHEKYDENWVLKIWQKFNFKYDENWFVKIWWIWLILGFENMMKIQLKKYDGCWKFQNDITIIENVCTRADSFGEIDPSPLGVVLSTFQFAIVSACYLSWDLVPVRTLKSLTIWKKFNKKDVNFKLGFLWFLKQLLFPSWTHRLCRTCHSRVEGGLCWVKQST